MVVEAALRSCVLLAADSEGKVVFLGSRLWFVPERVGDCFWGLGCPLPRLRQHFLMDED